MVIMTERYHLCLGQYEPCWFWYRFRSRTRVHILVAFARWSGLQADVSLGTRQVSSIVRVVSNDLPTDESRESVQCPRTSKRRADATRR